jgi:hypothetical protein
MDFVVPLHPEDLELPRQGQGRIYVQTVFDVEGCADIDAVIDGACVPRRLSLTSQTEQQQTDPSPLNARRPLEPDSQRARRLRGHAGQCGF